MADSAAGDRVAVPAQGGSTSTHHVEGKGITNLNGGGAQGKEDLADRSKSFWAAKTSANRNRERGASLKFYSQELSADRIKIPEEDWMDATAKYKKALVGFVFGSKPFIGRVKGFVRAKWGDESVVTVSQMNDGIFMLKFTDEEKKLEVLYGGPWTFDNRPFILKEWSEDEDYKCGSIDALPVWIRLPSIKAHISHLPILSRLCSRLGKPICTDGVTAEGTCYNYARVCVEIYADVELVDNIEYEDPYGNCYNQPVLYEWRPPRCTNCCTFGHLKENCPKPNQEQIIVLMREREVEPEKEADYREAADDNDDIEVVEETPAEMVRGENEGENQLSDSIIERADDEELSEVNANERDVRKENETNAFRMYVSKSAQKRARQKEKRVSSKSESKNSKSESNNAMRNKGREEVTSKSKKEKKGKGMDKGRKANGNTHTYFNV